MKKLFFILVIPAAFLLSACTGMKLDRLKSAKGEGSDFTNFLMLEYRAFAQSEADQLDWADSAYFAEKGLKAAAGEEVIPENTEVRGIKNPFKSMLDDASMKLNAVTTEENKLNKPELLARAQAKFDCWVENVEENWQSEQINACRVDFEKAIYLLNKTPEKPYVQSLQKPVEEKKPVLNQKKISTSTHKVFFKPGSTNLDKKAMETLEKIRNEVGDNTQRAQINVSGYADRSGDAKSNLKLSRKRAEIVEHELAKLGFSRDNIEVIGYGEENAEFASKDGKPEPSKRVVEIVVKY